MTRLLPLSLTLATLALAGCGQESDQLPEDGRDLDGVAYGQPGTYSGVVIDDYLRNARVWLDIDGDYQYTPGPMTVTGPDGEPVTLENGEPTALTGANGQFTLNIEELDQSPLVSADLDPRDYSLMVMTLPGQTVDETPMGEVIVEKAYTLTAPAGVRTVTPLTTLLRARIIAGLTVQFGESEVLEAAFRDVNLLRDYLASGDNRLHAYARAFVRYMAAQFPADASEVLRNGDGTERVLTPEGYELLAVSLARNAADIVALVDEAAPFGRYENVDIDDLALVIEVLDLTNPVVLEEQVLRSHSRNGNLPARSSDLQESATVHFRYAADGQLRALDVDGCMAPSLQEIARLANADGYIAETGAQWLPSVSLSQAGRGYWEQEGFDERVVFDWANQRATFETTTTCHEGVVPSPALGGEPSVTYHWTMSGGRVTSITDGTLTLTPDYANETNAYTGYRLADAGGDLEVVSLGGTVEDCTAAIAPEDLTSTRVISHRVDMTFAGYDPQPTYFGPNTKLDFDRRNGWDRLLRYAFLSPELEASLSFGSYQGFEWRYFYQTEPQILVAEQPNLVTEAYLSGLGNLNVCGSKDATKPSQGLLAWASSRYERLSAVLAGSLVE